MDVLTQKPALERIKIGRSQETKPKGGGIRCLRHGVVFLGTTLLPVQAICELAARDSIAVLIKSRESDLIARLARNNPAYGASASADNSPSSGSTAKKPSGSDSFLTFSETAPATSSSAAKPSNSKQSRTPSGAASDSPVTETDTAASFKTRLQELNALGVQDDCLGLRSIAHRSRSNTASRPNRPIDSSELEHAVPDRNICREGCLDLRRVLRSE